jgi:hypothetical protein
MLSAFFSNQVSTPFPLSGDLASTTQGNIIDWRSWSINGKHAVSTHRNTPYGAKKNCHYIYTIQHKRTEVGLQFPLVENRSFVQHPWEQ